MRGQRRERRDQRVEPLRGAQAEPCRAGERVGTLTESTRPRELAAYARADSRVGEHREAELHVRRRDTGARPASARGGRCGTSRERIRGPLPALREARNEIGVAERVERRSTIRKSLEDQLGDLPGLHVIGVRREERLRILSRADDDSSAPRAGGFSGRRMRRAARAAASNTHARRARPSGSALGSERDGQHYAARCATSTPRWRIVRRCGAGESGRLVALRAASGSPSARASAGRRASRTARTSGVAREARAERRGRHSPAPSACTASAAIRGWSSSIRIDPCCSSAPRSRSCALPTSLRPSTTSSPADGSAKQAAPPGRRARDALRLR